MKGLHSFVWVFVALIIIIAAGSGLVGMAHIFPGEMITLPSGKTCELKDGLLPLIGYYSCEPQGYQQIDYLSIPDASHWYTPTEKWSTCCDYNVQACVYDLRDASGKSLGTINIPRGSCNTLYKDSWLTGQRYLKVFGDPFALVRYSPVSAPSVVNNKNCRLPSTSNVLVKAVEHVGSGSLEQVVRPTNSLDFNQKSSFLAGWVKTPMKVSFVNGRWCASGGYIYEVQVVEVMSGACYATPNLNRVIEKKIGCPGEPCSIGGKAGIINSNFVCVQKEGSECSIFSPCPNQGRYTVDYNKNSAGTTAVAYSCVNGYCVPSWKTSECAANSACPVGQQCQFNDYTGVGKCVAVGTTPIPPQPGVPLAEGFNWIRLLKLVGISAVFTFVMMMLGRFVPRLKPVFGRLISPKIFLLVTAVLTAVFWFAGSDLKNMAIAVVISAAIVGVVSIFVPVLRVPMVFLITWIVVSLIAIFIFAIPLASLTASIFGGV